MVREEKGKRKREEKMERSWVMDALCVSVIPNYWTLPFKASLRCISHFCLSDWWRAGSDWGHCVLNTASLVIQYLLQIQYTAAAAPSLHRSSTTTFLICIRSHVLLSNVSLRSGLLWCDAKKNKITYHVFLKKCSKLQKYTAGNKVFGGRLHFDTEQCRCIQYLQLVLPRNIFSHFKAYHHNAVINS